MRIESSVSVGRAESGVMWQRDGLLPAKRVGDSQHCRRADRGTDIKGHLTVQCGCLSSTPKIGLQDDTREPDWREMGLHRPPGQGEGGTVSTTYGETWVYESIVGALPGIDLSNAQAITLQLVLFEVAIVVLGWFYGLQLAIIAGTAAVAVAGVGSYAMLTFGSGSRTVDAPPAYFRLMFGSSIEVVLSVLAFIALITHLFIFDPQTAGESLVSQLFGPQPPMAVVYLTLLVLWDLCYRIGTAWWAAVVSLWRAVHLDLSPEDRRRMQRLDMVNVGFGAAQLVLLPFLLEAPVLLAAVSGHFVAVTVVSSAAYVLS